ncbi:hypothetical protein BC828DRAFT_382729 [Blastocladiella britannica]|nr:hypothetical protein BC828DRAFT_382729 [Blastocladiella britannica]
MDSYPYPPPPPPGADFESLRAYVREHLVRLSPAPDSLGRPVLLLCLPHLLPPTTLPPDLLLAELRSLLADRIGLTSDYVALVYCAPSPADPTASPAAALGYAWFFRAYRSFSRAHRKNLKALWLVHPTPTAQWLIAIARWIVSPKFFRKVQLVDGLHGVPWRGLPSSPGPTEGSTSNPSSGNLDLATTYLPQAVLAHNHALHPAWLIRTVPPVLGASLIAGSDGWAPSTRSDLGSVPPHLLPASIPIPRTLVHAARAVVRGSRHEGTFRIPASADDIALALSRLNAEHAAHDYSERMADRAWPPASDREWVDAVDGLDDVDEHGHSAQGYGAAATRIGAAVLSRYFRGLPRPIIDGPAIAAAAAYRDACSHPTNPIDRSAVVAAVFPTVHYRRVVGLAMLACVHVHAHAGTSSRMHSRNLARVWAPTLVGIDNDPTATLMAVADDDSPGPWLIRDWIEHWDDWFGSVEGVGDQCRTAVHGYLPH